MHTFLDNGFPINYMFEYAVLRSVSSNTAINRDKDCGAVNLLLFACVCGQVGIVNELIVRGVDIEHTDSSSSTFIHYACKSIQNTGNATVLCLCVLCLCYCVCIVYILYIYVCVWYVRILSVSCVYYT